MESKTYHTICLYASDPFSTVLVPVGSGVVPPRTPISGLRFRSAGADANLNIYPSVHVRMAPEIPDHLRALELPHVPHLVCAQVEIRIERHGKSSDAPVRLDIPHRLVHVLLAKRQQQV